MKKLFDRKAEVRLLAVGEFKRLQAYARTAMGRGFPIDPVSALYGANHHSLEHHYKRQIQK